MTPLTVVPVAPVATVAPTHPSACAPPSATPLPRVPPPGPVATLAAWPQLQAWVEPRAGRCRRQGRPWSVLQVVATPLAPPGGPLADDLQARLLGACAHRLRASVRATDHVARVGDQGIAVLLDGAGPAGARAAAERLVRLCQGPYRIDEQRLELCVRVDLEPPCALSAVVSPSATRP